MSWPASVEDAFAGLAPLFYQQFCNREVLFRFVLFRLSASQGAAMTVRSLPMKHGKRLAHDVSPNIPRFWPHIPTRVHDFAYTDSQTQNGIAYVRVFASYKRRFC